MGDDSGDARPVRGSGEEAAEDVSGVAVDAELDAHRFDESAPPKWLRPAVWTGSIFLILAIYVFGSPWLIFCMEKNHRWPEGAMFNEAAEVVFSPIGWLVENSELYEHYLDWLQSAI